jgi:hypothetical protein
MPLVARPAHSTMKGITSVPPGVRCAKKRAIARAAGAGSVTSWNELEGTMMVR